MRGFTEQLMLAEKAAENIYFAKLDRELIESLHARMRTDKQSSSTSMAGLEGEPGRRPVIVKEAGRA